MLVAMTLAVAACSVPRDENARVITNPPRNTSVPVTTSNVNAERTPAKVYFVRSSDKKLEGVMTSVKKPGTPVDLLEALIVDGPQERRLESKIPQTATFQVIESSVPHELIVILQNFRVERLNRDALVLAFQQIVYTLTEIPDINSVQFSVNNAPYPVPLKSGDKPVGQGVHRMGDYDPETVYTTTTTTTLAPATTPATTAPVPSSAPSSAPAPTSGPAATSR
jgi:spore germination protein GerM